MMNRIHEEVAYRRIEIDRCTDCKGIWFDALEAEMLAAMAGSELIDVGAS
jgi:Zn-finger nucleic acid-binding protein